MTKLVSKQAGSNANLVALLQQVRAPAFAASLAKESSSQADATPAGKQAQRPSAVREVLQRLGLAMPDDLFGVTEHQCCNACGSPVDGAILWAIVLAIQIHLPEAAKCCCQPVLPPREGALPKLGAVALQGNFEDAPGPEGHDPLVLMFTNVFPSTADVPTQIYATLRSGQGAPKTFLVPAKLENAKDGKYSLVLGDDWLNEMKEREGIELKPGHILELQQKHGDRESPKTTIRINHRGPGVEPRPELGPCDLVGNPDMRGTLFRSHEDTTLPQVSPERYSVELCDGKLNIRDPMGLGTEPWVTITVKNLRTGEMGDVRFDVDGGMDASVAAQKGDPILMQILDGPGRTLDGLHERSLVMEAGRDTTPILVENPQLYSAGPQALKAGRLELSPSGRLRAKAGVTAGTVLSIFCPDRPDERVRAVASVDGSFDVQLPFVPHAKDVLIIEGKNAAGLGTELYWHRQAKFRAELEVQSNGSLELFKKTGAVAKGCEPVTASDNVDRASSARPSRMVRTQISEASVSFSLDHPIRQYEGVKLMARSDREYTNVAASYDPKAEEIVFRVGMGMLPEIIGVESWSGGGWPQALRPEEAIHNRCDSFGNADYSFYTGSPTAKDLRWVLGELKSGSQIPARYESPDGEVFARGRLNVELVNVKNERDTQDRWIFAKAGAGDIWEATK